MSNWDGCQTGCSIVIPVGEKGDSGTNSTGIQSVTTATASLSATDSGDLILFNRSTGSTITLPESPDVGTYYDFQVVTELSSGNYIIQADGSDVINGYIYGNKASTAPELFKADAALTDTTMTMNGTTTGGLIGTDFRLTYTDATNNTWTASGVTYGSGTLVEPWS